MAKVWPFSIPAVGALGQYNGLVGCHDFVLWVRGSRDEGKEVVDWKTQDGPGS